MAYEVRPWKREGVALRLDVGVLSQRESYSREINDAFGEGGALNADYQKVEAAVVAANRLGRANGLVYGEDFVFKTAGLQEISFDFKDEATMRASRETLASAVI